MSGVHDTYQTLVVNTVGCGCTLLGQACDRHPALRVCPDCPVTRRGEQLVTQGGQAGWVAHRYVVHNEFPQEYPPPTGN